METQSREERLLGILHCPVFRERCKDNQARETFLPISSYRLLLKMISGPGEEPHLLLLVVP
jgi:hypothetical protein